MLPTSSKHLHKLKLTRSSDLFECERVLSLIKKSTTPTKLLLPGDDRRLFFKDLRAVAVISAASRNPQVRCEWFPNVSSRTYDSLLGLAAAIYRVASAEGHMFSSPKDAKQALARRLDILEDPPGSSETLTFCAIDKKTRSQPVALSALSGKEDFISKFGSYVVEYFDKGKSENFSFWFGPSLFDDGPSIAACIYGFVYELYQNTFSHGSLDQDQNTIPGLRLIRLRKRVGHATSRDAFIQGASRFSELEVYLQKNASVEKPFKFYEISVSDNGMGILSRFRAVEQKKYKDVSSCENLKLLNKIIAKSLSSDMRKSKIGQGGLQKALRAVDEINGFVSLRSDNLWVYRSPEDSNATSKDEWLKPVENGGELSNIPGTHFSMIVPAS